MRQLHNNPSEYHARNQDWTGRILKNDEEIQIVPRNQPLRIFLNQEDVAFPPHRHSAIEAIMPLEGDYRVTVSGHPYDIPPEQLLIIPSQTTHSIERPEGGKRFIYLIDPEIFSELRGFAGVRTLMSDCLLITLETHAPIYHEITQLFLRIQEEYLEERAFRDFAIHGDLCRIFMLLARYQLDQINLFEDSKPEKRKEYFEKLQNAMDFIDKHYAEHLDLDSIAQYSGFSKFYFSRLFKEYTGQTFYDYLTEQRMKAAEDLLARTDTPITDVVFLSGFSSVSTFNRTMKEKNGCSPSEFRLRRSPVPNRQQQ